MVPEIGVIGTIYNTAHGNMCEYVYIYIYLYIHIIYLLYKWYILPTQGDGMLLTHLLPEAEKIALVGSSMVNYTPVIGKWTKD